MIALAGQNLREKQIVLVIWFDCPQQFKLEVVHPFAYRSIKDCSLLKDTS